MTLLVARQETGRLLQPVASIRVGAFLVLAAVAVGVLGPFALRTGTQPEAGVFVVEIDASSPLRPALAADTHFELAAPGQALRPPDLVIDGTSVGYHQSDLSLAALENLERAVRAHQDLLMAREADQDAAFPVRIDLYYEPRSLAPVPGAGQPTPPADAPPQQPAPDAPEDTPSSTTAGEQLADTATATTDLAPSQVEPPFPIRSLLLTFAYLLPLNFLSQAQAGSLHQERVRGRGLPLLSAPVPAWAIVAGRVLPYLATALVIAATVTILIGSSAVGFLAALPIVLFSLASAALLGLTTRGPRELTASLVAINVLLSSFLFLPAIFVQIHPIAFLSPVAVISATIRGDPVGLGSFLYATLPLTVVAGALALVSAALYREETLFAPASPLSRVVDGIARLTTRRSMLLMAGALAVPFALALEAFLLVFAISLDLRVAFVVFLVGSAAVEEALKGLVAYAALARRAPEPGGPARDPTAQPARTTLAVAALVGGGFFLGEKGVLLWSLIGLDLLPLGGDALTTFGISANPLLVLAPLALHIGAVAITAAAARSDAWRGGHRVLWGWLAATLVHTAYNGTIFVMALRGVV